MKTRLIRFVAAGYALLLTYLLASESTPGMVSGWIQYSVWLMYLGAIVHLLSHTGLAVLCMASRLPLALSIQVGVLVTYAVGMEVLHLGLEKRSFEWIDMAQNLSGLALGLGLASVFQLGRSGAERPLAGLHHLDLLVRVQASEGDHPS